MKMKNFAENHCGDVRYFMLGGMPPRVKSIRVAALDPHYTLEKGYRDFTDEAITTADDLPEPKRRTALCALQDEARHVLAAKLCGYRKYARELSKARRSNNEAVRMFAMLSVSNFYGGLYFNFKYLYRLENLLNRQPALFDL